MKGSLKITARQLETQQAAEEALRGESPNSINSNPANLIPAVAVLLGIGLDEAEFRLGELGMASWVEDVLHDHFSWN